MFSGANPASIQTSSRLLTARRDAVVLTVLISAVMLLIWNGSAFFNNLRIAGQDFGPSIRIASTALTLNVALILFGWAAGTFVYVTAPTLVWILDRRPPMRVLYNAGVFGIDSPRRRHHDGVVAKIRQPQLA